MPMVKLKAALKAANIFLQHTIISRYVDKFISWQYWARGRPPWRWGWGPCSWLGAAPGSDHSARNWTSSESPLRPSSPPSAQTCRWTMRRKMGNYNSSSTFFRCNSWGLHQMACKSSPWFCPWVRDCNAHVLCYSVMAPSVRGTDNGCVIK